MEEKSGLKSRRTIPSTSSEASSTSSSEINNNVSLEKQVLKRNHFKNYESYARVLIYFLFKKRLIFKWIYDYNIFKKDITKFATRCSARPAATLTTVAYSTCALCCWSCRRVVSCSRIFSSTAFSSASIYLSCSSRTQPLGLHSSQSSVSLYLYLYLYFSFVV